MPEQLLVNCKSGGDGVLHYDDGRQLLLCVQRAAECVLSWSNYGKGGDVHSMLRRHSDSIYVKPPNTCFSELNNSHDMTHFVHIKICTLLAYFRCMMKNTTRAQYFGPIAMALAARTFRALQADYAFGSSRRNGCQCPSVRRTARKMVYWCCLLVIICKPNPFLMRRHIVVVNVEKRLCKDFPS